MRTWHSRVVGSITICLPLASGCGATSGAPATRLFQVPLTIDGRDTVPAVIDTGGGYEVLLRDNFGLDVIDTVEVLAFGGRESVQRTEGFIYSAGGFRKVAKTAIVSSSICDCNGLGFLFFRETGVVLGLDFVNDRAMFLADAPCGGVTIAFEPPPACLDGFDTAFIEVEVASDGETQTVPGLLDTGAHATLMRRHLVGSAAALDSNRQDVTIAHDALGTVAVRTALFDTEGLPDIILGTDVMGVWADEWYFSYSPAGGGQVVIFRPGDSVEDPDRPNLEPRFLDLLARSLTGRR